MSYTNIVAGLQSSLAAVSGIVQVLDYMPRTAQETPLIYLLLDKVNRVRTAQGSQYTYSTLATLVVRWQDNDAAESTINALIEPIMAACDADMTLGGLLTNGAALVLSGDAGFESIGGTMYRTVEFAVEATELAC